MFSKFAFFFAAVRSGQTIPGPPIIVVPVVMEVTGAVLTVQGSSAPIIVVASTIEVKGSLGTVP